MTITKRTKTSKYRGVIWDKHAKKWRACGRKNNKSSTIGYFDSETAAAFAYDLYALDRFGDRAILNVVSKDIQHFDTDSCLIPLTQGLYAIVDNIDIDLTNSKWFILKCRESFHAIKHSPDGFYHMHRIILERMLGRKLSMDEECDHINSNGLDNRRCNLRVCSHQQNIRNRIKSQNKTSIYKGVCLHKATGKYRAYTMIDDKQIHLGYYDNEIDAALAYNKKAKELFGEFAKLNVIN